MASWRKPVLAGAIGLEVVALIAALDGLRDAAVAAHVASAAALALGLDQTSATLRVAARSGKAGPCDPRDRRALRMPGALVFAMAAFLPVLGALGWLAVAWIRPAADDAPLRAHACTPIPGPEAARLHAARPAPPRRGAPAAARVAAARGRDDAGATALLRRALADRDEDVRLVAHAVLESKQRVAYRRLRTEDGHDGHGDLYLAAAHWELARTDLADGECLAHALVSARRCARAAVARHPEHAQLALLAGRIALRSGKPAEAEAALARAIELGLPRAVAAPYLAEAAFLARRFDRVAPRLATADHPALARVRRFWS
jgi:hypothetical protein